MRLFAFASVFLIASTAHCATPTSADHAATPLYSDSQGRPATDVMVNGEGPFRFVIDTAAQTVAVGKPVIDRLALEPDPDNKAQLHGSTGTVLVDMYPLETLSVGGLIFENVLAPTLGHKADSEAVGILGMSILTNNRLTFDERRRSFRIDVSEGQDMPHGATVVPAAMTFGTFALVPVTINGVEVTAIVDSGARHSIANLALMEALGLQPGSKGISEVTRNEGVTGDEALIFEGFKAPVVISGKRTRKTDLSFSDLHVFGNFGLQDTPAMLLGSDVLRHFKTWGIDFREGQLFFVK